MAELADKANALFTENAFLGFDAIPNFYMEVNGKLYLLPDLGDNGSLSGTDYAYIMGVHAGNGYDMNSAPRRARGDFLYKNYMCFSAAGYVPKYRNNFFRGFFTAPGKFTER